MQILLRLICKFDINPTKNPRGIGRGRGAYFGVEMLEKYFLLKIEIGENENS